MKNTKHKTKNYCEGQTLMIAIAFLLPISIIIISGFSIIVSKEAKITQNLMNSKKSYFLSESGIEDVSYKIIKGKNYSASEVLQIDGMNVNTVVINSSGSDKEVTSTGNIRNGIRKIKTSISTDVGAIFFYGVQSGAGGMNIGNGSVFNGSLYSNGEIDGANNMVYGTVISAGPNGEIENIHATGTAYAHTIESSTIDKDAYYQHISGTTIGGTSHPGSTDQPLLAMPVADATIQTWENSAATNVIAGCAGGNLTISANRTLGPAKIPCNLILKATLTLTGPVWVEGNITIGGYTVKIDPSLGANSVALIADKVSDRLNSSKITMTNGATFTGTGDPKSYVVLVSMNNSAENNGAVIAIDINNNLNGDLFAYAPHGFIDIKNNSRLIGMTGYKINIGNNAVVTYETGLANMLFESGPGGGYSITGWKEVE